jgi:hypothetical protein
MSGGTGYRTWYNTHASVNVRLPRSKLFTARIFFWEDVIVMW